MTTTAQAPAASPLTQALSEAADGLARTLGYFSVDGLVDKTLKRLADQGEESRVTPQQLREAIPAAQDLVGVGGDKMTTQQWLKGQRTLARLCARKDKALAVMAPDGLSHPLSDAQIQAVSGACRNDLVAVIEGSAGAGKSFIMEVTAQAYLKAGWRVMVTAPSWAATQVVSHILRLQDPQQAIAVDPLLRKAERGEEVFAQPTLLILDGAEHTTADEAARLVAVAASATVPVKVLAFGNPDHVLKGMPCNAMTVLTRHAGAWTLGEKRAEAGGEFKAVKQETPGSLPVYDRGELGLVLDTTLTEGEKHARGVDPAILGRAFLQVMNDPGIRWKDRPFHEFSKAMAERATELDEAQRRPGGPSGRRPGRHP